MGGRLADGYSVKTERIAQIPGGRGLRFLVRMFFLEKSQEKQWNSCQTHAILLFGGSWLFSSAPPLPVIIIFLRHLNFPFPGVRNRI